jgi:hypothetical protein
VRENTEEERDVGLDSTDSELDESAKHLATSDFERRTPSRAFDEQRVVVRLLPRTARSCQYLYQASNEKNSN